MTKVRVIESERELTALESAVSASARDAAEALQAFLSAESPLAVLRRAKFDTIGADPLSGTPLNLVEQINQTFTYLATFEGLRHLFRLHPDNAPFLINLGTASGFDISSEDGQVVAEVFAAVKPQNNRKLSKDVAKLGRSDAPHRYVFYSCAEAPAGEVAPLRDHPGVRIISLGICGPA